VFYTHLVGILYAMCCNFNSTRRCVLRLGTQGPFTLVTSTGPKKLGRNSGKRSSRPCYKVTLHLGVPWVIISPLIIKVLKMYSYRFSLGSYATYQ